MSEWANSNIEHLLVLALVAARGADILSTYLCTPNLQLEANELARRIGWRFAFFTLPVCLVPYIHAGFGFTILVCFLLVAGGNFKSVWLARTIGETKYLDLLREAAREGKERDFLLGVVGHAATFAALALCLLFFHRDAASWGFYAAYGVFTYAFGSLVHSWFFYRRLQRPVPHAV